MAAGGNASRPHIKFVEIIYELHIDSEQLYAGPRMSNGPWGSSVAAIGNVTPNGVTGSGVSVRQ